MRILFLIVVLINNLESFGWYNQQYQPKSYELTRLDSNKLLTLIQEWRKTNFLPEYSISDKLCNFASDRVEQIQSELDAKVELPVGYYFTYGGQFENLKAANARLSIAVPMALALIFILLYFTFNSVSQAALIFTAIPLSAISGIWALQLRGLPFSISAGIGFIALFGVAVFNGIVLIGYFNQLKKEGMKN